jgi:hypothetical protein
MSAPAKKTHDGTALPDERWTKLEICLASEMMQRIVAGLMGSCWSSKHFEVKIASATMYAKALLRRPHGHIRTLDRIVLVLLMNEQPRFPFCLLED